jgi:hypothetical protein
MELSSAFYGNKGRFNHVWRKMMLPKFYNLNPKDKTIVPVPTKQ